MHNFIFAIILGFLGFFITNIIIPINLNQATGLILVSLAYIIVSIKD